MAGNARSTEKDFNFMQRLGKGSFGEVFKVQRKADNKHYVIKQIDIASMSATERREALQEVHILASIKSDYVTRYYDSFIDKNRLNIVMELCDMDLAAKLKKLGTGKLP